MKNFLGQDLVQGSVVYKSERQGSNNRMIGVAQAEHDNGDVTVLWCLELIGSWVPLGKKSRERGPGLVVMGDWVLNNLFKEFGNEE